MLRCEGVGEILLVGLNDKGGFAVADVLTQTVEFFPNQLRTSSGTVADKDHRIGGTNNVRTSVVEDNLPRNGHKLQAQGISLDDPGIDIKPVKKQGSATHGMGHEHFAAAPCAKHFAQSLRIGCFSRPSGSVKYDPGDDALMIDFEYCHCSNSAGLANASVGGPRLRR